MADPLARRAPDVPSLEREFHDLLGEHRRRAARDPFTNPFLLFALDFSRRLDQGEVGLDEVDALVRHLTLQGFAARAARLGAYLGNCDPAHLATEARGLFDRLAGKGDFDAYAAAVAAAPFGVVLTAHPTFALRHDLSESLVELATGRDRNGRALDEAARAERLAVAASSPHGPPSPLTLDVEHQWSVQALESLHAAMDEIREAALEAARARWPERWTELRPRLATLATWVGFDQDGRTDITWQVSLGKRLALKTAALTRRRRALDSLLATAADGGRDALKALAMRLDLALDTVARQSALLKAAGDEPEGIAAFSRALVENRDAALVDCGPLLDRLEAALAAAPDGAARRALLVMRAGLLTNGLSLAAIHVRLNAGQLHNAVRRQVRLETEPTDPANRRSYFTAIERLIAEARPVATNLGDLIDEPASARRLMMTLAVMTRFIDASTPVRFLIAETETGFTLLTALYYARLFGVEAAIEISPLFETEEAFERGEKVIEEALRSPQYRDHLRRHGRLAIEFGFSDSGRFIGQMAATFRIERLRLRLAALLEAQDLADLEVVFFNTHGESIGRGGHPASLQDRFRYAAPPRSRAEFAALAIRVKEEDAFQGGEGYLPLMTPPAALATLNAALASVLEDDPEARGDPIYDDPDFASEFFATIEQAFAGLVADPDYAALVGLFATHLLPKTGSRPVQRQSGDAGRPQRMQSVSELRAIPNNGVLQQLGYLANTLFGVGAAIAKDRRTFDAMRADSARFRRALDMAQAAADASELDVLRAYAATLDPAMWLDRAAVDSSPGCDRLVRDAAERAGLVDPLARVVRSLQAEQLWVGEAITPKDDARRDRLLLLHGVRIGLIQRICALAVKFPDFNPRGEITRAALQERLMRLDVPGALEHLTRIFPRRDERPRTWDFGEPSGYTPDVAHGYEHEHEAVFGQLARLYDLCLAITTALDHEVGACG